MKLYTQHNFFKHTYCEFHEVPFNEIDHLKLQYHSKSDSQYYYTERGVYRLADHWGRVANCRWRLIAGANFKNQKQHLGFAQWKDFQPLLTTDKIFFIEVDFEAKKTTFLHKTSETYQDQFLFTAQEAQKRVKQIRNLLKEERWATYFDTPIADLRKKIISNYINSNISLFELKRQMS